VPAIGKPARITGELIESSPTADARSRAVRADDPAGRNASAGRLDRIACDTGYGRRPQHLDARPRGLVDQMVMQRGATESNAVAMREVGRHGMPFTTKANAAEAKPLALRKHDPNPSSGGEGIGHEPFPAGFIDGRPVAVRDHDAEPSEPRCDRGCETSRSAADYKNVCV
jgi:hypothetical protein